MKQKILALVTVLALVCSLFTMTALADEPVLISAAPVAAEPDLSAFADADSIVNKAAVAQLTELGIIDGIAQEDGSTVYAPQDNITREQMAKLIAVTYEKFTGKAIASATKTSFTDVSGRWSKSYVAYCYNHGIINGRSEKVFDYAGNVTVIETAKMILAACGQEGLTGESWKSATEAAANELGLLEGVTAGLDEAINRDEAALMLSRAVEHLAESYVPAVEVIEAGEVVTNVMVTNLTMLANFRGRDDSGSIYVGAYINDGVVDDMSILKVEDPTQIKLDTVAKGPGYTAVYATGENSNVTVTGKVDLSDDTDGIVSSDFTGCGTAFVATNGATINIEGMDIHTKGFVRDAFIADSYGDVIVKASTVVCLGANPLTEAYDGYVNSANTSKMLSPPWVLGIQGGVRGANVLGNKSSLTVIDSEVTAGSWAVLSTDGCSDPVMNVLDSTLTILTPDKGGMTAGDFPYASKYGTGYGTYAIGNVTENFYGVNMKDMAIGVILREGTLNFKSSKGTIELKNGQDEVIYTGEGKGAASVVNSIFGVMTHASEPVYMYASDGTTFNTEEATILYKDSKTAEFSFDNCQLNTASGIILQMIDDDDSTVGMGNMRNMSFNTEFHEAEGWPSENGSVSGKDGGAKVELSLANGEYNGNVYNGTGYYTQGGDHLAVTIDNATLNGAVSLTETQHKVKNFTINEYYNLGHVENRPYYNGYSTLEVTVKAGSVWTVTDTSIVTKLVIEEGASVLGTVTENADGTLTLAPAEESVAVGSYGK